MTPSTTEAPNTCASSIAGTASDRPYGLYRACPFSVNSMGWMPSSMPTMSADAVIAT